MSDIWKQPEVARAFVTDRAQRLPDRARQLDVLLRLLRAAERPIRRVLDLGAGDGILLAAVLDAFPDATGVALDYSAPMLAQARARLAPFGARATVIEADLSAPPWQAAVTGPVDAVVSGFAIHHLPHARKRELYAEVYGLLAPGGVFVNTEHVASPTPGVERLFDEAMSEHLWRHRRERGEDVSLEQVLQDYLTRPDRAANILASVEEQCVWLRDLGYREVDCSWKFFELAVFGGRK